ncbi:vitamin K epoxide reductase family protein [Paenibacillus oceani]|uniref:Vitamin K epoxide reductase family protein n=1 Tax=Paenibacillus oceani TaxID=2772510 RepID=A0A927H272_9BACL|nr:vitamin K epoxide reductase family protein [Paenibacillus oceani]MBD2865068.1 vitamin K epoxide reductase family protein [Paenibacillus oceani]
MTGRHRLHVLRVSLAVAGALVSVYIFAANLTGGLYCPIGSCSVVNGSKYAYIGPFPVSLLGISYYLLLIAWLLRSRKEEAATPLSLRLYLWAGFTFSTYLTVVELFVLHAVCFWCVVSYSIVTAMALLSFRMPLRAG